MQNTTASTAHTGGEREAANAAAGEPLATKAVAFSMPGVTVDGGDPVAVHETVAAAVARARGGEGPTLVESRVYRLSAHGNILAPPGRPLHFPEHEAIEKFGAPEEYEAALRGDPVPRFRARLVQAGPRPAAVTDRSARAWRRTARAPPRTPPGSRTSSATRCRPPSTSGSRARSRIPSAPSTTST